MIQREDSDKILFNRVREDNRVALNSLFTLHYQNLCTFANTYLKNKEEAEECVADVFVNLWKKRKNIVIEKSFKAYIYSAVKYAAFAAFKKRNPAVEDIESLPDFFFEEPWGTEQVVLQAELEHQMNHAIETLPFRCRQVFLMSRIESLSYKEISLVLSISEKTVENHLVKALGILRNIFKPKTPEKTYTALTEA